MLFVYVCMHVCGLLLYGTDGCITRMHFYASRQQQNRAVVESRLLSSHQELTGLNLIPPVYTVLENGTTDTSGETETSLMGQSEQDNPASPPPPYAL